MPRTQGRPASPRGGVRVWLAALVMVPPRSACVSWPRRLCAPSRGGICAVSGHASEEPRLHDSAGYAARASRAEAALPSSHSGGSKSARQVGASCARSCLSDTASPHMPSPARLPIPLLTTALARPYVVPYSPLTSR
ncbi:hypothetical protein FB451DRAFT_1408060 [Mycena latifolia]|nr:hypothetical protein FB451DRAFT_1408060 [Mycena latifolia]